MSLNWSRSVQHVSGTPVSPTCYPPASCASMAIRPMGDPPTQPLLTRQGLEEIPDHRHRILHQVGGSGANGADYRTSDHLIPKKTHH